MKDCEEVVRVIHVPSSWPGEYLQIYLDAFDQKGIGFFGPKEGESTISNHPLATGGQGR